MFNQLCKKIWELYRIKATIYFDSEKVVILKLTISVPSLVEREYTMNFYVVPNESFDSLMNRFKHNVMSMWGNQAIHKQATDIVFEPILNRLFSTYLVQSEKMVSVFFTDNYPQAKDFSCNKLFIEGEPWHACKHLNEEREEFHQNSINRVKEAANKEFKQIRTVSVFYPTVNASNEVSIYIPEDMVNDRGISISYTDDTAGILTIQTYKFRYDEGKGIFNNWGMQSVFSKGEQGLLSIRRSRIELLWWMKNIKFKVDLEQHPYNPEIHNLLNNIGKATYIGKNVWVTKSKKLFIRINDKWTPVDIKYMEYVQEFSSEEVFNELQMVLNILNVTKRENEET